MSGKGGEEELTRLVDLISTNKTDFFREPVHFDFLREQVLPQVQTTRSLRIWSSASSSGEEPYTIAMTLNDAIPDRSMWDMKILASDIFTRVLAKAASGILRRRTSGSIASGYRPAPLSSWERRTGREGESSTTLGRDDCVSPD